MAYVEYYNFSKGLVNIANSKLIDPANLQKSENADVSIAGEVKAYKGLKPIYTLAFPDEVQDIFWQNIFTTKSCLCRVGDTLYDGITPIGYNIATNHCDYAVYNNWIIIVNGDKNYKYDQQGTKVNWHSGCTAPWELEHVSSSYYASLCFTKYSEKQTGYRTCHEWERQFIDDDYPSNFETGYDIASSTAYLPYTTDDDNITNYKGVVELGIDAPTTSLTATAGAAGNVNGTVKYKVVFVNEGTFESNGNTETSIVVSSKKVELTNIPLSNDPQVVSRYIYRTTDGGATYRYLTELTDNHTTSYTDNTADGSLSTIQIGTTNDKPPAAISVGVFLNQLFLLQDPNTLWWSNSYVDWEYFSYLNYEPISTQAFEGKKLIPLGEELLVFGETEIWRIGGTIGALTKYQSMSARGTMNLRTVTSKSDRLIFADTAGLFAFDTLRDTPMSTLIDRLFIPHSDLDDRISTTETDQLKASILHYNDLLLFAYVSYQSPIINKLLYMNTKTDTFGFLNTQNITSFTVDKKTDIIYASIGNNIYQMFVGLIDSSTNEDVSFTFKTKSLGEELGGISILKQFKTIKSFFDLGQGNINVKIYIDDQESGNFTYTSGTKGRNDCNISKLGYTISIEVTGTKDAIFYGFGLEYEKRGIL